VNDPKLVTPAYLSFIEKNIRARFGLEGAPLRIFLKARTRKDPSGNGQGRTRDASDDPL
jgi:predicted GTPase